MGLRPVGASGPSIIARLALAASVAGAAALSAGAAVAACSEGRVELRGDWGTARFRVDIADTPETRARGLMFVEEMPQSSGMLFVFPEERVRTFWMRNTYIPLDIIYFDASGAWVSVQADAVPFDETSLPSDAPAQYVLEVNAGLAEAFGMGPGTELRHPALNQEIAAWPCAE
ncbi:DUF192 domain-containing protein [Roseibacterium sp. SDUM158017]|uniref:DUF192 domain-containing protein n=1 Tax=Roseicyclus salinarum TaxID=3036773 RepID=UPI0024157362|nr:DUF192 domain-containing protein [Roseibacterium sp. SDUM158017]MDG4648395.1 DUF192 domain-containing protein [Roseibacterium sp. SDUM158017]